MMVSVY